MQQTESRELKKVPLRPELMGGMLVATATLMLTEFVRLGFYMGFLALSSQQYGLNSTDVGIAWSAHLCIDTLMRGPAGAAIQRFGSKLVVMTGILISIFALSILLVAHSSWALIITAALHAIGFSPMWPATLSITADATHKGYHGRVLSFVGTSVMPMTGVGLLAFGSMSRNLPPKTVIIIAMAILAAALALSLLLTVSREVTGSGSKVKMSPKMLKALAPLIPAAAMQTLTQSMIISWALTVAPKLGLDYPQLIALLAVCGGAAIGLMPIVGRLADRGRARLSVAIGYSLVALALSGIAFVPPVWVLFLLAPVAGLGYALLTPGWSALLTQMLPESRRPMAWGMVLTIESAGFALGPALGARAIHYGGPSGLFGLCAVLAAVTAMSYIIFRRVFESPIDLPE